MVTGEDVGAVFRHILKREPEASAFEDLGRCGDLNDLLRMVVQSPEAKRLRKPHPCEAYNAQVDAEAIVRRHEDRGRQAIADRYVSYFGVAINPAFVPAMLAGREGQVEADPLPNNWHSDTAEFAAALRAVELASGTFTAIELGCGWACWLLLTGTAARRRGLRPFLIGAEADEHHVGFAHQALAENGFDEGEAVIHRAIVGPRPGTALFPRQSGHDTSWGLMPVFDADEVTVREGLISGRYDALNTVTISSLLPEQRIADLLHIDIQGGEAEFVRACISDLNERVAYMVIGTHSRQIEGALFDIMLSHGWVLEIERPMILKFEADGRPVAGIDGVQGWRNPRLR